MHQRFWLQCMRFILISGFALLYAKADLDMVLNKVSKYEYGESREALTALNTMIVESLSSPAAQKKIEQRLIDVLNSDATLAAKEFICSEISLIGSEKAVVPLLKLLENEKTENMALFALQRIPAENINEQLRLLLTEAKENKRIKIINTLGERKDKEAVVLLAKSLNSADSKLVMAAAAALGKIAGDEAALALKNAIPKTSADVQWALLDAYLQCADAYMSEASKARTIYEEVFTAEYPLYVRSAALFGIVKTSERNSIEILLTTLKEEDEPLQSTAISLMRELPSGADLIPLTDEFSRLSSLLKIQMLAAMTDRKETSGRELALQALDDDNQYVRIEALQTLAVLGNENDVLLLANIAAKSSALEKDAARKSLSRLNGQNIDRLILSKIPESEKSVKAELIYSIGQRNIQNSVDLLFETIHSTDPTVRKESFQSLSVVASENDFKDIIELLINPKYAANLQRSKSLAVKVALRYTESDIPVNLIVKQLSISSDYGIKNTLLNILGKSGNKKALQVLQKSLKSSDKKMRSAAISALTLWPDTEPLNDLLEIVQKNESEADKQMALRGYIRILGIDKSLTNDEKVLLYKTAMDYSEKINEQRMVITGLAKIETIASMDLLVSYLDSNVLKAEIHTALLNMANRTARVALDKTKAVLSQIISTTSSEQQRENAKTILKQISGN